MYDHWNEPGAHELNDFETYFHWSIHHFNLQPSNKDTAMKTSGNNHIP